MTWKAIDILTFIYKGWAISSFNLILVQISLFITKIYCLVDISFFNLRQYCIQSACWVLAPLQATRARRAFLKATRDENDFRNFETHTHSRANSRKSPGRRCQSCRICHARSQFSHRPTLAMHFWATHGDSRQLWFNGTRITAKIKSPTWKAARDPGSCRNRDQIYFNASLVAVNRHIVMYNSVY